MKASIWAVIVALCTLPSALADIPEEVNPDKVCAFVGSMEPDRPWRIVALSFKNSQTGEPLPNMLESRLPKPGDRRPYARTTQLFRLEKHWPINGTIFWDYGYRPVELNGVRTPPDTLAVIAIRMTPGDSAKLIAAQDAWVCCIDTSYYALDEVLPRNSIEGTVFAGDDRSPLAGATIYCEETGGYTSTNDSGHFSLGLGKYKSTAIRVLHPQGDSIRFDVSKVSVRSIKEVNIYLSGRGARRSAPAGENVNPRVLLVGYEWFPGSDFLERPLDMTVQPIESGFPFEFSDTWSGYDCLPFHLVKVFPNDDSVITFLDGINVRSNAARPQADYTGVKLTIQLQPDFAPRHTLAKSLDEQIAQRSAPRTSPPEPPDECDTIMAEVERIHLRNYFVIMDEDFDLFAQQLSPVFTTSEGPGVTGNSPRAMFAALHARMSPTQPLSSVFDFQRCEVYVHGMCDEWPYQRYLEMMERAGLEPEADDVYVRFPFRDGLENSDAFTLVYRQEASEWKIICE